MNRFGKLKALSRVLRWQFASRILPEASFVLPFGNGKLFMRRGMTGATGNWYCGLDEVDDMGFVLHVLRRGDWFVDAGANIGSYSILAATGSGANVIAVEPILQTFASLQANIRLNNQEDLITAHCVGLSSCCGTLRFTTTYDTVNHVLAEGESAVNEEITVTTLDKLLGATIPTVIKIDVEGHELSVMAGAEKTLSSPNLLAVVMEINGSGIRYGIDDRELDDLMKRYGFEACRYSAIDKSLKTFAIAGKRSGNTIFVRNIEEIERRIKMAPKIRLVNGWL